MNKIDSNLLCPSCQNALTPKVLSCDQCNIVMQGPFQLNEFATLPPEDLHFLRIFIRYEGRIRDMEPALGLSYPTIRNRLSDLKNKLATGADEAPAPKPPETPQEVLALLEKGQISFEDAMARIKKTSKK